jgi:hypothetical protein
MIAALFLLVAAQQLPESPENEIVVVGKRLASISVSVARDAKGKFGCSLSQSSGSGSVDAQLCKAAAKCAKQGALTQDAMRGCIEARKPAILEEFGRRVRAGKRG